MSERSTRASSAPTEEDLSLKHVIDAQHRLDELGTARLVGDAAEAVHKAQTGGQPLGTLSPTAIFVVATGRVKLEPPKSPNTAYSAPERLRGSAGDRRSDVFSLGVILWEALAHARLFQGATDDAIKTAVLESEIRPPSESNANIPAELDAICKKALARDPADRYQSAKVMAAEISAVLDDAGYPEGNEDIARYLAREFPDGPPVELVLKPPVIALNTPKPKAEPKLDPKATILGVAPELKEAVKAAAAKEPPATIQDAVKAVVKAADQPVKDEPEHTAVDGKAMDAKNPGDFASKLPTTLPPPKTPTVPPATKAAKPAATKPPVDEAWAESKPTKAPTPAAGVAVKTPTPAKGVPASPEASSLPAWARANGTSPPATQPAAVTAQPAPAPTPAPATIVEPSPSQTLPGMPSAIGSSPIPPMASAPTAVPATGSAPASPAILTSPPSAPTMLASHPGMVLPPLPPGATQPPPVAAAAGAKTAILGSTDANAELKAAIAAADAVGLDTEPMPAMGTKPPPPVAAKPSISNAETVPTPALAAQPAPQPPPLPAAATATAAPEPTKRPGSHSDDFAEEKSAPHPAQAVTLPRARTRGDKTTGKHDPIGGWGWGTDSHEAIPAHDDDDYYDDSAARQKKRLLIAIGSAVGAILLVTMIAFAMKGGKNDEKKEEVSATKPNDTNTAVDWKSSPGSGSADVGSGSAQPTEPPKVEGSAAEPPKTEGSGSATEGSGSATEPTVGSGSAAEPPKQEAMVAPPPAPEPPKPEPPKPEPPKVEPKKPEPPKVEPKKPPEVAAKKPEPKKPEVKKPTPPPAPKKPPEVAVKKPADPKPVDPYATVATPAPKADSAAAYKAGVQQLAKGDANGALATFKASLAQNPGFAPTWRGIGLVYERMGKKSQAKTAFQRYLQLNPNAGDADAIRERLERLGS